MKLIIIVSFEPRQVDHDYMTCTFNNVHPSLCAPKVKFLAQGNNERLSWGSNSRLTLVDKHAYIALPVKYRFTRFLSSAITHNAI